MDLGSYLPFYWTGIANGWTAASSRTYSRSFDIGVVEWRVLATLLSQRRATALDVARLTGMDVGAASRAVRRLIDKMLVEPVAGRFRGRSKPVEMTAAGHALAIRVHATANARADLLLADLSDADRATLLHLLARVHAKLPQLREAADID